jgi:hypothetical protein
MITKKVSPYTFPGMKYGNISDPEFPFPSIGTFKSSKEEILEIITEEYDVTVDEIFSKCRKRFIVDARYVVFAMLRRNLRMTLTDIGRYFEGRDHTTVMHGISKFKDLYETDDVYRNKVNRVYCKLKIKHIKDEHISNPSI